jgi:hypothetical protein
LAIDFGPLTDDPKVRLEKKQKVQKGKEYKESDGNFQLYPTQARTKPKKQSMTGPGPGLPAISWCSGTSGYRCSGALRDKRAETLGVRDRGWSVSRISAKCTQERGVPCFCPRITGDLAKNRLADSHIPRALRTRFLGISDDLQTVVALSGRTGYWWWW